MWEPDKQELLILFIQIIIFSIIVSFLGGAIAGIITLIITRKKHFAIEMLRLFIGAIGGLEGLVISLLMLGHPEPFIYLHQFRNIFFILSSPIEYLFFTLPGLSGALGASVAIILMRKLFRWSS